MKPTDRYDVADSPPPDEKGIVQPRMEAHGSFIKFALKNPDSDAAKILRLQNHSLTDAQINELDARLANAARKNQGFSSFLSSVSDFIVTVAQSIAGMLTGNGGFKDFSKNMAGRTAMRNAALIYEELTKPGPNGHAPYAGLAEQISGVTPDGQGGYTPVLDKNGKATGIFRETLDNRSDPMAAQVAAMEDRGIEPSQKQRARSEVIYHEEIAKLYKDESMRAIAAGYKPDPLKPGKDLEAQRFVNDPRVMKRIEAIADRHMTDVDLKKGGGFQYSGARLREQLIGRFKWRIAAEHKANSSDITHQVPPITAPGMATDPTIAAPLAAAEYPKIFSPDSKNPKENSITTKMERSGVMNTGYVTFTMKVKPSRDVPLQDCTIRCFKTEQGLKPISYETQARGVIRFEENIPVLPIPKRGVILDLNKHPDFKSLLQKTLRTIPEFSKSPVAAASHKDTDVLGHLQPPQFVQPIINDQDITRG